MSQQIQTFGEVLADLLKSRKRSVGYLCQKMQISSQTTVARILKDEYSYDKIKSFYDEFAKFNPFYMMEFERVRLEQGMEVNKVGKDIYAAKQEMMYFVNMKPAPLPYTHNEVFGAMSDSIQTLNELFMSYHTFDDVRIFIVNCLFDGVIHALSGCLSKKDNTVTAEHYIAYEQSVADDSHQFITLLPVLNYRNYNCFKTYFSTTGSAEALNQFHNMIVVLKRTSSGERYTDLISICQANQFSVLYNQSGIELFDFYDSLFKGMKLQHNPIKSPFKSSDLIDNMTYLTKQFLEFEEMSEQVIIKPCFCFYSVSGDVLGKLWSDDVNEYNQVKKNLIELHNKRFEAYCRPNRKHLGIYSKQGVLKFLETGKFCDHLPIFRAFTKDEAREVTQNIIAISEKSSQNKIYLLKNDIVYNNYQYTLFDRQILFFCNKNTDYTAMNFDYIINSSQIISVFCDFIEDELIRHHCHTAEESLAILKSYVK